MEHKSLHVGDYIIFAGTLLVSLGIGFYHSFTGGKQKTTNEYLMGNRQMNILPVTISMTVSYISTITMLGYPAEMYAFGAQFSLGIIAIGIGGCLACAVFVPVFYPLQLTSVNEVGHNYYILM